MVLAALLAGCTAMLPHGSSDTPSPFSSYAEANAAAERILPLGPLQPAGESAGSLLIP